jgi:hypothetical protein
VIPLPPLTPLDRRNTHRLIPSHYSLPEGASVLTLIAADEAQLADLFDLDGATNDRLLAETDRLPGIGVGELVFGVPHFRIVNAAFCHPHPLGGRFNGPERGCWYAGFEPETSLREVAFHKTVQLQEIGVLVDDVTYDDYTADFRAEFHDLRGGDPAFGAYLAPDSYVASQGLAETLLASGARGLVYPSVRHCGGTCIACFHPKLVSGVRKGPTYRFIWSGTPVPSIERARAA